MLAQKEVDVKNIKLENAETTKDKDQKYQ